MRRHPAAMPPVPEWQPGDSEPAPTEEQVNADRDSEQEHALREAE